jgi:hypothetical protein
VASSESDRARNAPSPETAAGTGDSTAAGGFDLRQLDRVLESTLAQLSTSQAAIPPELVEVGRHHRGQPLTLPVAGDLVYAVLWPDWQELAGGAEGFRTLCAQIAETLFEDPRAHARLRNLWSALGGMPK